MMFELFVSDILKIPQVGKLRYTMLLLASYSWAVVLIIVIQHVSICHDPCRD